MNGKEVFPILKQSADIAQYAKYIFYLKLALGVVFTLFVIQIVVSAIRRHFLPAYRLQKEEDRFFLAFAHAFNLDDEETELVQYLVRKEKLAEPHLIFCSPRVFDPSFCKEVKNIQGKKLLPDWKKGQALKQLYRIREKIF